MTDPAAQAQSRDHEMALRQLTHLRQQRSNLDQQLRALKNRDEKLTSALGHAREEIVRLKKALAQDLEAPMNEALVLAVHPGTGATATATEPEPAVMDQPSLDVVMGGRRLRVPLSPVLESEGIRPGMRVLLTENVGACACLGYRRQGDIAVVREVLDPEHLVLGTGSNTQFLAQASGLLQEAELAVGDAVAYDPASGLALSTVPKTEAEELVLEETPEVSFEQIGGLGHQIEQIRDAVELPFLEPELYREHDLKPPKGILLYGPPGNGKTLIAKAVAASLAQRLRQSAGDPSARGYFLNIKGPELLDKYVGETERQIRAIFSKARDQSDAGNPVVIFFDEMESLFRTRGAGKSSDVETTIVPQLLAEIDGVESLDHVIVIGATNREDMIDPAVMRPGRLDVKVRIDRPDQAGTQEIFGIYLHEDLPLASSLLEAHGGDRSSAVGELVQAAAEEVFAHDDAHRYLDALLADGRRLASYWSDFVSGALVRNVVDRAKKRAIKDYLETGSKGLSAEHLRASVQEEFLQQRDAASRTDVEEWLTHAGYSVRLAALEPPRPGAEALRPDPAPSGKGAGEPMGQSQR